MAKFNLNQLLSNASIGAGENKEEKMDNTLEIIQISVFDLIPSENNFYSVADIEELKDSIEMFGVKQNLTVKEMEDGKYKVIAGHRRRLATLELVEEGKEEFEFIPCAIETELDEIREQLLLITTNATTRQLTDYEKTEQARRIRDLLERYKEKEKLPGRMRELIASTLNTSPSQVGRMDSISKNLSSDFKEEFKEDKINISAAYEISTLPEDAQEEVYGKYQEQDKISIKEVKEKKEEIKKEIITEEQITGEQITGEQTEEPEEAIDAKKEESLVENQEARGTILSIHEIMQEMSITELAEFICSRCDISGRFCDLAIECDQAAGIGREEFCMRWLKMQAQKKG